MRTNTDHLTSRQASEFLGVSLSTLYRMNESGIITPFRTPGGQRRYSQEQLEEYKEKSKNIVAPQNPSATKGKKSPNPTPVIINESLVDPRNKLNDLSGKEWIQETKSYMFQKGLGASNAAAKIEKQHPAPFSYQDIARLIQFFTKHGQTVLDPFGGVGSTIKACAFLNRKGIQIELSEKWHDLAIRRIKTEVSENEAENHTFICGDSVKVLKTFECNSIDFIVTSPPYWSILNKKLDHKTKGRAEQSLATNYSNDILDLGNILDYQDFLSTLADCVFSECGRILKQDKYCCIIVSDFRNKSEFISFHSDLTDRINHYKIGDKHEFQLQGIKVLLQNHKSLLPYGYPFSFVENIHHQYILIFKKIALKRGK